MGKKKKRIVNREISWLSFNERVLQEAADATVPLIERLKFLGIFSSNLDEFFRVRVSSLRRMVDTGIYPESVYGGTPRKILKQIHNIVVTQRQWFDQIYEELEQELEKENIFIIDENELNQEQKQFVQRYFAEEVRPALAPIMIDSGPKFPYLKNQVLYLAIQLTRSDAPKAMSYALIEVPTDVLPRYIVLPKIGNRNYIIMLDDVIRHGLKDIFSIFDFDQISAYTIKITRDAEIDIDDDVTLSTLQKISKSVEKRSKAQAVRFVHDREIPKDLLSFILRNANLAKLDNIIPGGRYHNARDFMNFPNIGPARLRNSPALYLRNRRIDEGRSVLDTIKQSDLLLH